MTNYFEFHSSANGKTVENLDLTASEIAASVVPALIGITVVGLIALLMLL